jgi:nucleotidyltransferase substrate binding protein (TIGR01987 family)
MDILTQRTIARFAKAVVSLEKALALKELPEHAERDAVLLRFEFVAELMPKVLSRVLAERGETPGLPKDAVRSARVADLLDEASASALLIAIDDRNRMVHDYSEKFATALLARVKKEYFPAFQKLLGRLHNQTSGV